MEEGRWKALKASRRGPRLSHLFFDNDLTLFTEASDNQIECIKEGLDSFCGASGQKVNFHKSLMYCSSCVSEQDAARLSAKLKIPLTT